MSFFKKLFNTDQESKEEKVLPWQNLVDIKQLDTIKEKSKTKTQLIFKHSTRCGISRMVLNQFVEQYDLDIEHADLYFLDLLIFRQVFKLQTLKLQSICNTLIKNTLNEPCFHIFCG